MHNEVSIPCNYVITPSLHVYTRLVTRRSPSSAINAEKGEGLVSRLLSSARTHLQYAAFILYRALYIGIQRLIYILERVYVHCTDVHTYMYIIGERERANLVVRLTRFFYNWRARASQPSRTTGTIFLYNIIL